MARAIVQHRAAIHGNSVPNQDASVVLASSPTIGNLLLAFVGVNIANSSLTINTSKWTVFERVFTSELNDGSTVMLGLYRYVDGTDTTTLPPFATAGSTYWTDVVYEISGVTGSFETDLLFSMPVRPYRARVSGSTGAPFVPVPAPINCIAICATVAYNGSTNPSVGGSWTSDESLNNNSNYGSASGFHRAMTAGQTIDGTPVHTSSSGPWGAMVIMLSDATYPTTPWVRRIWDRASGSGSSLPTTTPALPWIPRQGALLIGMVGWQRGDRVGEPVANSGWTEYKSQTGTTGKQLMAVYRYVQVGDTGSLPAMTTSSGAFNFETIVEITGVLGTFSVDHVGNDYSFRQASGGAITTTTDTTTAVNQIALVWFGHYNASTDNNTVTGTGWIDFPFFDVGSYGGWNIGLKYFPSSGSSVSATLTPDTTTDSSSYIQSLFGAAPQTVSGPFLSSAAATYAPTVTPVLDIPLPTIVTAVALHAPTVAAEPRLDAPFIASGATLYAPSVANALGVALPLLVNSPVLYAMTVASAAELLLPTIASTAVVSSHALFVNTQTLTTPAWSVSTTTYGPTTVAIVPPLLVTTPTKIVNSPTLNTPVVALIALPVAVSVAGDYWVVGI